MKRSSGVLMHASSLWGEYSVGSFGKEAREWIDFLQSCGYHAWQVLPFCLPDECNSPYKSHSAFSSNPYFIDLPTLFEEGLLTKGELDAARQKTPYACEFDRLRKERFALLSLAATRVKDRAPAMEFLKDHPQVDLFCRYMAIKANNDGACWDEWETETPDESILWMKHFALNNKETNRKNSDSRVSQRAAREIYLKPFEYVVKHTDLWYVMSSYNIINGCRASECKELLTDILRGEWGFDGMVSTDWHVYSEQYKEIKAGNDLRMPGGFPYRLMEAMDRGLIAREEIETSVKRILQVILRLE